MYPFCHPTPKFFFLNNCCRNIQASKKTLKHVNSYDSSLLYSVMGTFGYFPDLILGSWLGKHSAVFNLCLTFLLSGEEPKGDVSNKQLMTVLLLSFPPA